jgi:hypothetical protein
MTFRQAQDRHSPSYLFACCLQCDEFNPSALMRRGKQFICGNCEATERGRPKKLCERCGKYAPHERHHKHGRQISNETEINCVNCHRIVHATVRYMCC